MLVIDQTTLFLLSPIRDITEGKPLQLEVMGIEYMNDDPAVVDVLYAKVGVKDGSKKWVDHSFILLCSISAFIILFSS